MDDMATKGFSIFAGTRADGWGGSFVIVVSMYTMSESAAAAYADEAKSYLKSTGVDLSRYPIIYVYSDFSVFRYRYPYQPRFDAKSVDLEIGGDMTKLFTTQSQNSMRAFATVMAAAENQRVNEWLGWLGFEDIKKYNTKWYQLNDAVYYIAHKKLDRYNDLVVVFVEGTQGWQQWVSDFNAYSVTNDYNGSTHDGFWQAEQRVLRDVSNYVYQTDDLSFSYCKFAIGGYSRGAAIANLLAGESVFNADNCVAYTFATPNTLWSTAQSDAPWIINVVDEDDYFIGAPGRWTKYGATYGYTYNSGGMEAYYGSLFMWNPFDIAMHTGAPHHVAENYIYQVFNGEPQREWNKKTWWWTSVHCPTDIKVIHNGEIVAIIESDVATSNDDKVSLYASGDGEKDIIMPFNEGYQVIIETTGGGSMDVSVNAVGEEGPQDELSQPKTYPITDEQVYEINFETGEPVLLDKSIDDYSDDFAVADISSDSDDNNSNVSKMPIGRITAVGVLVFVILIIVISASRRRRHKKTSNYR
jgi:hypothetical protein